MRIRCVLLLALFSATGAMAQSKSAPPIQIYGGYSWLSNSFNGVPGSHQPLNGWNAGIAFQEWHHLRLKIDYSMFRGTSLGDPQHAFFILGGGQYERYLHREGFFAEALVGEGGLNGAWFDSSVSKYKNGNSGMIASLAEFLGGGIDTPISRHTAFRIEGGVQHSGFEPITPLPTGRPYHLDGIPSYFGRLSAGLVWMPRPGSAVQPAASSSSAPVESEIVFEGMNSVGHFKIFANSWWTEMSAGGIQYYRHSWGSALGAHVDYSAELLPAIILRQPSVTDEWGNPKGAGRTTQETVAGIGLLPIGVRLLWADGARVEPYYVIMAGMTVYDKKAFSQDASYENFALDQSLGLQIRLSGRVGLMTGFGVFHESNGFVVPSNPGLDEMNWKTGISYQLGRPQPSY